MTFQSEKKKCNIFFFKFQLCKGILSVQDIYKADQIDDLSIMENIMDNDLVQSMESSMLFLNPDLSFETKLESNLDLTEKN